MKFAYITLMVLALAPSRAAATLCSATTTLDTYVALGGTGCTVDSSANSFILKDFNFTVVSSSGITPATAADITVALATPSNFINLSFTSSKFSVSGTQSLSYRIDYTVDPRPVILIEIDSAMFTSTPVAPGTADSTVNICSGAAFSGAVCPGAGTAYSTHTFHYGTSSRLTDAAHFATPVNVVGIRAGIDLKANGSTSSITGIGVNTATLPEPGSWLMLTSALALFARRRAVLR